MSFGIEVRLPPWRAHSCAMPLRFHVGGILHKRWGGPPGPRGSPWTRSSPKESSDCHPRQAGQGAGCGPGGPPHLLCQCSRAGKLSGIAHSSVPRRVSELPIPSRVFKSVEENELTHLPRRVWGRLATCGPIVNRSSRAPARLCAASPTPGSTQIPRHQQFGVSTRRFCALWQRASTGVSTRHATVRAPHLPVRKCEVIRAWALSGVRYERLRHIGRGIVRNAD
jgi:hypothetical protein